MATSGRPHLTIAQASGLVAAIACGMAALRNPSRLAADLLLDLALLLTAAAAIVAACGRGRARAFWAGFAIAGAAYLSIHLIPAYPASHGATSYRSGPIRLLDACFQAVPRPEMVSSRSPLGEMTRVVKRASGEEVKVVGKSPNPAEQAILAEYYDQIDEAGYRRLGHAAFALIAGTAGGMLALIVAPSRASPWPVLGPAEPIGTSE